MANHNLIVLLSVINVYPVASQVTVFIVFSIFHHAATQNPGHGTKFVTLPILVLLKVGFYVFGYL